MARCGAGYRWPVWPPRGLWRPSPERSQRHILRVYAALGEHNLFIQRGKRSFGLRRVHFIGPGIDAKQQIALLDLLVIANRQFDNAAADFRNHINRIR